MAISHVATAWNLRVKVNEGIWCGSPGTLCETKKKTKKWLVGLPKTSSP